MKITELKRTCYGHPSQWEGKLENGKMIFIYYRYGIFEVSISKDKTDDIFDAVRGETLLLKVIGDEYDGYMSDKEMIKHLKELNLTLKNNIL